MSAKHTPGPWMFDGGTVDDARGLPLLTTARAFDRTNYADIHLAAAAPDLLEALNQLMDDVIGNGDGSGWTKAQAAIAKAEGRT